MLSLMDINKSIVERLRNSLKNTPFKSTPIINTDLEEGFERPSLKIDVRADREQINTNYTGRTVAVDVYFFASDIKKYKIENLKIQDIIENTFLGGWSIAEGCFIHVYDIESDIVDTVLIVSFEFEIVNQVVNQEEENAEYMETLNLELKGDN